MFLNFPRELNLTSCPQNPNMKFTQDDIEEKKRLLDKKLENVMEEEEEKILDDDTGDENEEGEDEDEMQGLNFLNSKKLSYFH